jgi:hypothetical protein
MTQEEQPQEKSHQQPTLSEGSTQYIFLSETRSGPDLVSQSDMCLVGVGDSSMIQKRFAMELLATKISDNHRHNVCQPRIPMHTCHNRCTQDNTRYHSFLAKRNLSISKGHVLLELAMVVVWDKC